VAWLPSFEYVFGLGGFIRISRALAALLLSPLMQVKMVICGTELASPHDRKKLPLVLFSHGIGGTMNMYSSFCCELASLGMVVAAVEHQDESAATTITPDGNYIAYQHTTQDLLGNDGGYTWRHRQQEQRVQEIIETHTFLESSEKFGANVNFESCVVAGHSFGGATSLAAATARPDLFQCMLAVDAWLWPILNDDMDLTRITRDFGGGNSAETIESTKSTEAAKPPARMLFIDSADYASDERWWGPKVRICEAAANQSAFVRIAHATHHVTSDVPLLAGQCEPATIS
jgi:pimeloyl-ACP methyl ester carboxylesterase